MGRWRAVVPILLAFIIAGAGSYYVHQWLQRQSKPPPVETTGEKIETVPVLVAATDIEWGTELSEDMFKKQAFPVTGVPKGHFTDTETLVGRVSRMPISQDVPILESLLAPDSVETGGITAVIKQGRRAIAVAGNKVLGLSGLIVPGNRVDVLLTTTDPDTEDTITKTVLEDLLVLAAGPQMQRGEEGRPSPVDVYTLEVTPQEAERITLAGSKGKLGFALRSYSDTDIVLTQGEKLAGLLASYREEPAMIADLSPPADEPELAAVEAEPCKPCEAESTQPAVAAPEEDVYSGPEVQVEIINGTDRKVQKYKL